MSVPRPASQDQWRTHLCSKCGHEWACSWRGLWVCARCEWPPMSARGLSVDEFRAWLVEWIDQQLELRTGKGSYAKGQRMLLNQFRREVLKDRR